MTDLFTRALLGHLVGDYLLQSKKMALKKSQKGLMGIVWCLFHCLVYTLAVCLFLETTDPLIITLVFMSHYPIDRWSLANKWLKMIGSRDFIAAHYSNDEYKDLDVAFSCLVYAVADNTLHLVLLWLVTQVI